MQNRAVIGGGRSWATYELTLLAVDELLQGMEIGRCPCRNAEDGGSCQQQEIAIEWMKVARAAGA
jgi:hypothetical protein